MDKQTEKDLVEGLKVEYDSTDQDYYSVLGLRPKELDKTTKNSLNKTQQNLLSAISKSGYKKKKELSDCKHACTPIIASTDNISRHNCLRNAIES
jgi:hypothetical protein